MMVLPDYSSGNNERDIHVKNFNINVGGLELLDCADLKLAYGRKVPVRWGGGEGERRGLCAFFVVFSRILFVVVVAGVAGFVVVVVVCCIS